jgi:hypothetical protein
MLSLCAFDRALYHVLLEMAPSIIPAYQSLPLHCLLFLTGSTSLTNIKNFVPLVFINVRQGLMFG